MTRGVDGTYVEAARSSIGFSSEPLVCNVDGQLRYNQLHQYST